MSDRVIKVGIADDHHLVRQMLVNTLTTEGLEIVGQAANGTQALDLCQKYRPNVLVLDLKMPDIGGAEVTKRLAQAQPEVGVLILTAVEEEGPLFESLAAGARGYLLKDASVPELIAAVRTVADGGAVLHPRSTLSLLNEFQRSRLQQGQAHSDFSEPLSRLTPREQEVLRLIGQGLSNREIGEKLIISEKTAKTHVANLLRRIGAKDRVAAAIFAVKAGLCE